MEPQDFAPLAIDLRYGLAALVAVAASLTDVRSGRIPDLLSAVGALAAVILVSAMGGIWGDAGLSGALLAAGLTFGCFLLAYYYDAAGGGDVKLATVMSFLAGWPYAMHFLANTSIVGAAVAMAIMAVRFVRGQPLTKWRFVFSPALCLGIAVTWWGLR